MCKATVGLYAMTCDWPDCDAATIVQGAKERDDGNVVVEEYECADGHAFHKTVEL